MRGTRPALKGRKRGHIWGTSAVVVVCLFVAVAVRVVVVVVVAGVVPTVAGGDGERETRYEICVVSGVVKSDSRR